MRYFLIVFVFFFSFIANGQVVRVLDRTSAKEIAFASVYNSNFKIVTQSNQNGVLDISLFKAGDTIFIQAIGYAIFSSTKLNLDSGNGAIFLNPSALRLNEVVIGANRFSENTNKIAQQIQVISNKELVNINQQTTADVLQKSGNILVQKSQGGGGSPIIRGFEANKVLMVVDGIRMNNAIYRGGHLQNSITIDNTSLEKVEIIFGPSAVVYGSDALGGVIHFFTKNPILSDTNKIFNNANAFARSATANNEKTVHIDFNIGSKKLASFTSITFSDFDDLRQGGKRRKNYGDWGKRTFYVQRIKNNDSVFINNDVNIQTQSGYSQFDAIQKFLFQRKKEIKHILNFQFSTSSNIPRYDRLTLIKNKLPRFAEWYYGPQQRLLSAYTLQNSMATMLYQKMQFIVAYQHINESRFDRSFNNLQLNKRAEKVGAFTLNLDFLKNIKKHEIRYGIDAWYNRVNSTASATNIISTITLPLDTRYPDGGSAMQSIAAFLNHTLKYSEKIIFNTGLRINYIGLKAQFSDKTFFPFPFNNIKQSNNALNGNIGIVYKPNETWHLSVMGANAFRAPNVDDLSKVFESVPGKLVVPNPNLKPENTYNIDLSISKLIVQRIQIGASAYYTWYNNAIAVLPAQLNNADTVLYDGVISKVLSNTNANKAYLYGISTFLNVDITRYLHFNNTFNYTYGRIKTDSIAYPLDHIPPFFGKSSLHLHIKKLHAELFVMYNGGKYAKDYNLIGEDNVTYSADPINGLIPAWHTWNVRINYQFLKSLNVQLAVENMMDLNYRMFASNIGASGRNFIFTLKYSL